MELDTLIAKILLRSESFLEAELSQNWSDLSEQIDDRRILVIGAAGSIGSAFVKELMRFQPANVTLVDISENGLAEVVRDLRSGEYNVPEDFQTLALDFGSVEMANFLAMNQFDYVVNYSALKHVRSERDPFTLMRLLDVNVLANARLLDWLASQKNLCRISCVSSDKAVKPANLMGASKALMERVFLDAAQEIPFSSSRFANVAFSNGSLLDSFKYRVAKRQPISAPNDIRRFFISPKEAGQLCLLSCFSCNNKEILFPKYETVGNPRKFSDIAIDYLETIGYEPVLCSSAEEAKAFFQNESADSKRWPCYFSETNTSGEKIEEEFFYDSEQLDMQRFTAAGVVVKPQETDRSTLKKVISGLNAVRDGSDYQFEDLLELVSTAVPELTHHQSDMNLDQKM